MGTGFPPARSPCTVVSCGMMLRRAKAGRKRSCAILSVPLSRMGANREGPGQAFAAAGFRIIEDWNQGDCMPPRLLVVEGNTAEARRKQVEAGGTALSDGYAEVLRRFLPDGVVDICYPADPGANLPLGGLEGYDGVAITGSALNVYDGGPAIEPQIELARAVLKSKTPLFGSC